MSDLFEKFLPRFAALAETRLRRAIAVAAERRHEEAQVVGEELHSMAGEAGLLGIAPILESARRAELLAKKYHSSCAEDDASALAAALRDVEAALAAVCAKKTSPERTGS
jgi:hypothetical protein